MITHALTGDGESPLPAGRAVRSGAIDIRIVSVWLDRDPALASALLPLLSDTERARAARFRFDQDRSRFIVTRGRLRQLLGAELQADPTSLAFEYGPCGKPRLGGAHAESELHFNVSHSCDLAIVGLARGREVGLDVEALQFLTDADDIALRFFSQRENQAYARVHPDERMVAFYNCWTRKEALVKALGQGLSYPLDSFDVSLAPGEPARLLRLGERFGAACGWHLQSFVPAPGFVAALAIQGSHNPADVRLEELSRESRGVRPQEMQMKPLVRQTDLRRSHG